MKIKLLNAFDIDIVDRHYDALTEVLLVNESDKDEVKVIGTEKCKDYEVTYVVVPNNIKFYHLYYIDSDNKHKFIMQENRGGVKTIINTVEYYDGPFVDTDELSILNKTCVDILKYLDEKGYKKVINASASSQK